MSKSKILLKLETDFNDKGGVKEALRTLTDQVIDAIIAERKSLDLSQTDAGIKAGVSMPMWHKLENHGYNPAMHDLAAKAAAVGLVLELDVRLVADPERAGKILARNLAKDRVQSGGNGSHRGRAPGSRNGAPRAKGRSSKNPR